MGKRKSPSRMEWESGVGPLACLVGSREAESPSFPTCRASSPDRSTQKTACPSFRTRRDGRWTEPVSHHVMWWCTSVLAGVWLDDCLEASPDRLCPRQTAGHRMGAFLPAVAMPKNKLKLLHVLMPLPRACLRLAPGDTRQHWCSAYLGGLDSCMALQPALNACLVPAGRRVIAVQGMTGHVVFW